MTSTQTVFDSTDALSDVARTGLEQLLLGCADTKLLLGYHYGEWTFGTPALEAAVANCSLAQSELGHVRLLHALLKKHYGHDPEALVAREPAAFASMDYLDNDIQTWAGFVAMNFVVDMAVTRVIHSMRGSTFKPVRMSVEKMLDEEQYHAHHGQGWFRSLATRSDEARKEIERCVTEALESVAEWFGPLDEAGDAELVAAGIKADSNPGLFAQLFADVTRTAGECGAAVDAPELSFNAWDPATRRAGGMGPSDEILYHLRGSKNAVFKVK